MDFVKASGKMQASLSYTATDLSDIAEQVKRMKEHAIETCQRQTVQREARFYAGRADALRQIEELLRATTLVVAPEALRLAVEFGFKQHEKGYNLEGALAQFNDVQKGGV